MASLLPILSDLAPFGLSAVAAVALVVVGGAAMGIVLVLLPADHFQPGRPRRLPGHPALRLLLVIGKNLLGGVLVTFGILLSIPGVPGPGLLTILIGGSLIDYPGRDRFECWVMGHGRIREPIDRLRERFGREPFVMTPRT